MFYLFTAWFWSKGTLADGESLYRRKFVFGIFIFICFFFLSLSLCMTASKTIQTKEFKGKDLNAFLPSMLLIYFCFFPFIFQIFCTRKIACYYFSFLLMVIFVKHLLLLLNEIFSFLTLLLGETFNVIY